MLARSAKAAQPQALSVSCPAFVFRPGPRCSAFRGPQALMASSLQAASGSELQQGLQASPDLSRGRKRKLEASPVAAQAAGAAGGSSMASNHHNATPAAGAASASASGAQSGNGSEQQLPRGQRLADFVENWEFRWDLQRQAYPWEWASDSRLSDGPHNIIRYDQGPPKGWKPK